MANLPTYHHTATLDKLNAEPVEVDAHTLVLLERITEMQLEQQKARDRIEELSQSKLQFQQALSRLREEKEILALHHSQHEKLQAKLTALLKEKDIEQQHLREQLETFRHQTQVEMAAIKAERDAALSKKHPLPQVAEPSLWQEYQYAWIALAIGLGVLLLGIITVVTM